MDVFSAQVLVQGTNTIEVLRASDGDNILIGSVAINWKEQD
jgi:hypothetical protein